LGSLTTIRFSRESPLVCFRVGQLSLPTPRLTRAPKIGMASK